MPREPKPKRTAAEICAEINTAQANEKTRGLIEAGALIGRLQRFALDLEFMDQHQIKAAQILLNKVLPDLRAVEHSGEITAKVEAIKVEFVPAKP